MISSLNRTALANSIRGFHQDEEGNEMIQTVAIVAVSIIILAFVYKFIWGEATAAEGGKDGTISNWVAKAINTIVGFGANLIGGDVKK